MKTLILLTVLVCSSIARGELLDRAELLQAVSGSGDLAEWTAKNGLNLPKVVENCLDGASTKDQVRAWKLLVYFLDTYGGDGAAGEDLSAVGPSLSKLIDDAALLNIVAEIPEEHWDGIPFGLDWRFNYQALSDAEKSELQKAHPIAVRAIKREIERILSRTRQAEQDGAGQPATAPESKSDEASFPIFAGTMAFRLGRTPEAEEYARMGTDCKEGYPDEAWHNLGGYLAAQQLYDEALECYHKGPSGFEAVACLERSELELGRAHWFPQGYGDPTNGRMSR